MQTIVVPTAGPTADEHRPPVPVRKIARAVFIFVALLAAGCASKPAVFTLNTEGRNPEEISLAQDEAIRTALDELFGTPNEPRVPEGVQLDLALINTAAGPIGTDMDGNHRGLYRQHCTGCHGVSGSGTGPTARSLNPYPRDFRSGVFKYTSTSAGAKPTRDDLRRTLTKGVHGTAMPSFGRLPDDQIEALIEYVKYLSIRGQTELYLFQLVIDEEEYLPLGVDAMELLVDEALWYFELWAEADEFKVYPPPQPSRGTPQKLAASIAAGAELYAGKDAECVKCHGPEGRGDGEETELYDDWNKPKKGVTDQRTAELAGLFTLPIQQIRPRDFTEGTYRGGNRPIDLYWRIHVGIKGTPMPAAGPAPGSEGVFTPEEIWHVVNYLKSLEE